MQKRKFIFTLAFLVLAATADFGCDQGGADPVPPFGVLDTSFNGIGYVTHGDLLGLGIYGNDAGNAIAIDAAGRILVAGYSSDYYITDVAYTGSLHSVMAIWRYNPDGTLDTSFNDSGYILHHGAAGGDGWDIGHAIVIDSEGRMVVAGCSDNAAGNSDMVIWRYNPDGTLDATFNGQGYVIHNNAAGGNGHDCGKAVAIDASGGILVTGYSINTFGRYAMTLWKYYSDGSIDITFNNVGYEAFAIVGEVNGAGWGNAIVIDAARKILVVGTLYDVSNGSLDMTIWRYDMEGALDKTFNGKGYATHNSAAGGNGDDWGNSIAIDLSGNILIVGTSSASGINYDMVIWRYYPDGTFDTTFNNRGYITHNGAADGNGSDQGENIILDSSGRILVAGFSLNDVGSSDMVIWRYDPDGTLDASFNGQGYVVHNNAAGGSSSDDGNAIIVDSSAQILVAGSSMNVDGNSDMVIWRYK